MAGIWRQRASLLSTEMEFTGNRNLESANARKPVQCSEGSTGPRLVVYGKSQHWCSTHWPWLNDMNQNRGDGNQGEVDKEGVGGEAL